MLRRVLASTEASSIVPLKPADNFPHDKATGEMLLAWAKDYDQDLSRIIVLTVFSNFEAYIRAVLLEIYERQGGIKNFVALTERRCTRFLKSLPPDVAEQNTNCRPSIPSGRHIDHTNIPGF